MNEPYVDPTKTFGCGFFSLDRLFFPCRLSLLSRLGESVESWIVNLDGGKVFSGLVDFGADCFDCLEIFDLPSFGGFLDFDFFFRPFRP